MTAASLHTVGHGCRVPLHVKVRGKSVKEVAAENPLSRGGHTHTLLSKDAVQQGS